jgi:Flp pilus assembly protein TadG
MRAQRADREARTRRGPDRCRTQTGAAAVEFALVLPLLMMLLFGMIEFSVLLYDKAMITNASREGARRGIVYGYPNRPTDAEIKDVVSKYCASSLISFKSGSAVSTTVASTGSSPGDSLTVTVSYQYDFLVLPSFVTAISGPATLQAITVMRLE